MPAQGTVSKRVALALRSVEVYPSCRDLYRKVNMRLACESYVNRTQISSPLSSLKLHTFRFNGNVDIRVLFYHNLFTQYSTCSSRIQHCNEIMNFLLRLCTSHYDINPLSLGIGYLHTQCWMDVQVHQNFGANKNTVQAKLTIPWTLPQILLRSIFKPCPDFSHTHTHTP